MRLFFLLLLIPFSVAAAPFVVSDPTDHPAVPNYCSFYFDGALEGEQEPTVLDDEGLPYCQYDVGAVAVGNHTVTASFVVESAWGREEGPQSVPLDFVRPPDTVGLPAPVLKLKAF